MKMNRRNVKMQSCRFFYLRLKNQTEKIHRREYENVSIPENHTIDAKYITFSLANSEFPVLSEIGSGKRATDKLTTYNIARIMPL